MRTTIDNNFHKNFDCVENCVNTHTHTQKCLGILLELLLINEFSDEPYSSMLLDRKMIILREERLLGRHQREEVDVGDPHHRENLYMCFSHNVRVFGDPRICI